MVRKPWEHCAVVTDPGVYFKGPGRDEIGHLDYYRAYTVWRIAAIYQGIIKRVEDGTAASSEASSDTDFVRKFAATAMGYAAKAGL